MNKIKELPKVDTGLLWVSMGLLAVGLLILSSASSVISFAQHGNSYWYLMRQILQGAIPGLIFMYIASRIDYHVWQKLAPLMMFVGIGLLVAVLVRGIGFTAGGATRWINFRLFLFQPAEFMKLAI